MRQLLLSTVAALALTSAALAGGSHANVQYPSPDAFNQVGANVNLGGFGRLFPVRSPNTPAGLLPHPSPRYDLLRLGQRMTPLDEASEPPSEMPAAYVFLGQFIDHDITFDTVTSFDELAPEQLFENARTSDLDLDCVYGGGPERDPYLYNGPYLRVGAVTVFGDDQRRRHDVLRTPRPGNPTAVIGDPRNDENFMIAQVQAAFVAYHNRMVDRILEEQAEDARQWVERSQAESFYAGPVPQSETARRPDAEAGNLAQLVAASMRESGQLESGGGGNLGIDRATVLAVAEQNGRVGEILEEAREATVHHYHRVIAEDFVPRIIGIRRTQDILENGRDFYFPNGFRNANGLTVEPFIPLEFAAAAYRFAHSQVPGIMRLRGGRTNAIVADLFGVSGESTADFLRPRGFSPVRTEAGSLAVDWNLFVPIHGEPGLVQRARRIDTTLADPLAALDRAGVVGPGGLGNLASRNLTRGRTYLLPSGQGLARVILERLEARGVLQAIYPGGASVEDYVLPADATTREMLAINVTPLWYYILQEAEAYGASFQANVQRESAGGADGEAGMLALPDTVSLALARQTESAGGGGAQGTGATLGPVGATLVGEVLLGLIDYHRSATNAGIDLNPHFDYELLDYGAPSIAAGEVPAMTETAVYAGGQSFGRRYLLRNFLHDAGVTEAVVEADVCAGVAVRQEEGC